ncbi:MAG: DUF3313 family protein [Myxococcales bacterium]|nr:DUF3313 family protein [Myxococcales bacterium]
MHLAQWASVAIATLALAGCASIWTPEKVWTRDGRWFALPVWTSDGMYLVSGRAGALFLTPPPLDLSRYRGVLLEEIQIRTKHGSRELKPAEEERLKGYFTRRLERVFERNGWPMVETPGEDVLRARLLVKDLELGRWRRSHFGTVVSFVSGEKIGIILELRDALKGDRRLLFGDRRRLPFGAYAGSEAISIRRVKDAFYYFSIDVRRRLGQAKRGEFPPPPRPS